MKEGHNGLRGQAETLDALLEEFLDHLGMMMMMMYVISMMYDDVHDDDDSDDV